MNKKRTWVIALILSGTAGYFAVQKWMASSAEFAPLTPPAASTFEIAAPHGPTFTPTFEGCAFVWAYHDAPELTAKVNDAVGRLNPQASANASLFGEDCIYEDGHSTFSAMETDFYVRLQVQDLTNKQVFGDWMFEILQTIAQVPREEIQGNYGFVEFWFIKDPVDQVIVQVPLQQYFNDAQGLSGVELFQMFYKVPVNPAPT